MSRIGKQPVTIPANVEVKIDGNVVNVKGPKGELSQSFESEFVSVIQEDGKVIVTRSDDSKSARARHGLYRSLIQNLMEGVTQGFSKKLEVRGVGYRVAQKGQDLVLRGFSARTIDTLAGGEMKRGDNTALLDVCLYVSGFPCHFRIPTISSRGSSVRGTADTASNCGTGMFPIGEGLRETEFCPEQICLISR